MHDETTCHLGVGMRWDECLCPEIDPSDRPCLSCRAIALSAHSCPSCLEADRARSDYRYRLKLRAAGADVLTLAPGDPSTSAERSRARALEAARRWRACVIHGIDSAPGCGLCTLAGVVAATDDGKA